MTTCGLTKLHGTYTVNRSDDMAAQRSEEVAVFSTEFHHSYRWHITPPSDKIYLYGTILDTHAITFANAPQTNQRTVAAVVVAQRRELISCNPVSRVSLGFRSPSY